nr:brain-enriched guanylate kinase-associated protein-like isoform X2 [Chrysemys picta bellii]
MVPQLRNHHGTGATFRLRREQNDDESLPFFPYLQVRNSWVPTCLWQPRILQGRLAKSSPTLWDSTLQEQKGELRKRLSYTTHKLEMLETEFDSTRQYLEIELRRAQEELEKVTEKLRRIQNNYLALQRINQDLEDKLYRMVSFF